MMVILIGASPFGSAALARLGLPFLLVIHPGEETSRVTVPPIDVMTLPYEDNPLSILSLALSQGKHVQGIFSTTELGLLPAALLGEVLGVPAIPIASVLRTRNKFWMRRMLDGHVPQPLFGLLSPQACLENLPYPLIVKPVDGSGSEHVLLVEDEKPLKNLIPGQSCWLWEQFIDGPEFSVETVSFAGRHLLLGITEKLTTGSPHFVEVGHIAPAGLDKTAIQNITSTVFQCLDVLSIRVGAAHTEVKYVHPYTFIIESHTRPGGDRIPLITELVHGYDQYELSIRSLLNLPQPEPVSPQFALATVHYFQWKPGKVAQIQGVDAVRHLPGVVEVAVQVKPGNAITTWKSSDDRPGFVVVGASYMNEMLARLAQVQSHLNITYE